MNSSRRNSQIERVPGASDLIEDSLLIVGYIKSIKVVVSSEVVIFIGTGNEACSHLVEQLLRHSSSEESELLSTSFHCALSHEMHSFKLSVSEEAVVRGLERSQSTADVGCD